MKKYLFLLFSVLVAVYCLADEKTDKKNRKIADKEEEQFQKALRMDPDTANTYFEHASRLSEINTECARAGDFYKLALKYDTTKAEIYKAYGKYLFDIQKSYTEAKKNLQKGLALSPGDQELKNYLVAVDNDLALQEEDTRQRSFGTTTLRVLNSDSNFSSLLNFDSLGIYSSVSGRYNYQALLNRYLANDSLTPGEMYMLIVGYSRQKTYNPFNYNDITELKMLSCHNIDSAIKKGNLLETTNPLNPSLNREMMYLYRRKNDEAHATVYLYRIIQYFNGVLYSGNGTCEKPYISLWAREEYNFITYLGCQATENHSMGACAGQMAETIAVNNPTTQKQELLNFNVGLIYRQAVGK